MKNLGIILLAIWLIALGALALFAIGIASAGILLAILAIAAGVLILWDLRGTRWNNNLGMLLLGIYLILRGALPLLSIGFPSSDRILDLLAIAAGVLLLLNRRGRTWRNNLGMLLLSIWLILTGLLPLLSIGFPAAGTLMAILAIAAGILLLLRR
jgi:hypothetical protein